MFQHVRIQIGGPTLTILVDGEKEDPNTTTIGTSSARQQNDIKWHFAGVPMKAKHADLVVL